MEKIDMPGKKWAIVGVTGVSVSIILHLGFFLMLFWPIFDPRDFTFVIAVAFFLFFLSLVPCLVGFVYLPKQTTRWRPATFIVPIICVILYLITVPFLVVISTAF